VGRGSEGGPGEGDVGLPRTQHGAWRCSGSWSARSGSSGRRRSAARRRSALPGPPMGSSTRALSGLSRWPLPNVPFFPFTISDLFTLSFPHFLHFLLQIDGLPPRLSFFPSFSCPRLFWGRGGGHFPPKTVVWEFGMSHQPFSITFQRSVANSSVAGAPPIFFHSLPRQKTVSAFPRGGMGRRFGKILAPSVNLFSCPSLLGHSPPLADRHPPLNHIGL